MSREEYRSSLHASFKAFNGSPEAVWKVALKSAVRSCKLRGGSSLIFTGRYLRYPIGNESEVILTIILDAERGEHETANK